MDEKILTFREKFWVHFEDMIFYQNMVKKLPQAINIPYFHPSCVNLMSYINKYVM